MCSSRAPAIQSMRSILQNRGRTVICRNPKFTTVLVPWVQYYHLLQKNGNDHRQRLPAYLPARAPSLLYLKCLPNIFWHGGGRRMDASASMEVEVGIQWQDDEYRYGANDGYNLRLCFRLARAARSRCMSDHQIISTGADPPWIRGHVIISYLASFCCCKFRRDQLHPCTFLTTTTLPPACVCQCSPGAYTGISLREFHPCCSDQSTHDTDVPHQSVNMNFEESKCRIPSSYHP